MKKLNDHGCPKIWNLGGTKADEEKCICSSYPFRPKTSSHCTEHKAKLFVNFAVQHLRLYTLKLEMYCQYLGN